MKIPRTKLLQHVELLRAGGAVDEAILFGGLGGVACSLDGESIVSAPEVADAAIFPEPVGVQSVEELRRVVRDLVDEDADGRVEVEFRDPFLVLGTTIENRSITVPPAKMPSPLLPDAAAAVFADAPDHEIAVSEETRRLLLAAFRARGGSEVEIFVGPTGTWARIGDSERVQVTDVPLIGEVGEEADRRLLLGPDFFDVLGAAAPDLLRLGGPEDVVVLEAGAYRYAIFPRRSTVGW